ncbi:MAG: hypothetical protein HYR88_01390 [Verrucomicrobia bacterium]|nr:hypothetical protein [Verrucomicrobiota bacterium]MBI3868216.1 hypothetical protein [Verrucomicrobiota bacterium]
MIRALLRLCCTGILGWSLLSGSGGGFSPGFAAGLDSLRPPPKAALPPPPIAPLPGASSAAGGRPSPPVADPAAPLPPPSMVVPRGDVEITSEGGFDYEGDTGRVLYRKKVKVLDPVDDPRTIITAEWLTTIVPPPGGKVGEIIALTNVVIKILDPKGAQTASGNKAVYNATNDVVTIYGDPPILEMPSGTLYGDGFVVFNRITSQFQAPGRIRMVARQGVPILGIGGTNAQPRPVAPPPKTDPKP